MGCGRVGSRLSRQLEHLGHSVAVIDHDSNSFRRLGEEFSGITVTGEGFDQETLAAAGIERADAFAAVSSGDNSNIISARVARELFGVRVVVARIYDPKRAEVYERLGIPTVATVPWTSARLLETLLGDAASEQWRDGEVVLLRVSAHDGWAGRRLADLETATGARAAYVTRFGTNRLPTPSMAIQAGDVLFLLATDDLVKGVQAAVHAAPEGGLG
ncbi:MAG: trkA [Pseudonocardiales bacterium]|nr:trkA [Jatrophihabitantaceae bacterium]MCW2604267.1 trkA [Pseudonocardiales bacterium]